jgi:hypothetical protein
VPHDNVVALVLVGHGQLVKDGLAGDRGRWRGMRVRGITVVGGQGTRGVNGRHEGCMSRGPR